MNDPGREARAGEGTCLRVANLKEGGVLEKATWGKVGFHGITGWCFLPPGTAGVERQSAVPEQAGS